MTIHPNTGRAGQGEPDREDSEFAQQLGAMLRTTESPSAGFDARVMAAVREAHAAPSAATVLQFRRPPAARRRSRTIALPLVAWGALAAGFAAIVSLGTLAAARTTGAAGTTATPNATVQTASATGASGVVAALPAHDTVYVVRFVLADANARTVTLVGDFNAWAKRATPLRPAKPGVWSTQVALPAGRHEYAFLVDGKRWVADPAAERLADDFDTPSSVVTVGRGMVN
jgi:hypothetical protein